MDWSDCPDVESTPGKVSGAFVVKGTRIPADDILMNLNAGLTAEEIADEVFDGLSLDSAQRVIAFAGKCRERMPG